MYFSVPGRFINETYMLDFNLPEYPVNFVKGRNLVLRVCFLSFVFPVDFLFFLVAERASYILLYCNLKT